MRIRPSEQSCESAKVRVRKQPVCTAPPARDRRGAPKQEGMRWRSKMQSLAARRKQGQTRRDRSGAPMKRG